MNRTATLTVFCLIMTVILAVAVSGDVPQIINYQGRLTDGSGNPLDTTVSMVFTIYNDSAGPTIIYAETLQTVVVEDGLFNVELGKFKYLPDTVFTDDTRWLGIKVGDDAEISPQTRFISVPYAFHADYSDTAGVALSGPAGQGGWSDDGAVVRLTTGSDNVGIGTSSPTEKLDVSGNIHASGTIKSGSSITIDGTTDEIRSTGGVIGFDDEDLETSGNIRIGNTAAIESGIKLGIRENVGSVSPFIKLYPEQTYPSDLLNPIFEIYNPGYDYTPLSILAAGAIIQSRSNTKAGSVDKSGTIVNQISPEINATFFNAGNVGIGTDSPSEALEVAGTIYSTTGGFRFPDGSIQTSAAGGGITGVYGSDGLTGGGSSGDISLSIADGGVSETKLGDNSVTSEKILDEEIADWDISNSADIAVTKIHGTAVNLIETQTVLGEKTFNGNVYFRDSIMKVNSLGVSIGTENASNGTSLLNIQRTWNTALLKKGLTINATNNFNNTLYGLEVIAQHADPGTPSYYAYGTYSKAVSNVFFRRGIFGRAETFSPGLTTGFSTGVMGEAQYGQIAYGVYGAASDAVINWAGYFSGDVYVTGTLSQGGGVTKIDHPLDPENKYLQHAYIGSNEMKNFYDGTVITDAEGLAVVQLPEYFEAINVDFRYQLTVIGTFAQAIILEEIHDNRFVIKTDQPNVKVSWLVTGIRNDAWSKANQMEAEKEKLSFEKGRYLHPEAFGLDEDKSINYEMRKLNLDASSVSDD